MHNRISILKFADVKIPKMQEDKSSEYVKFGVDNKYPSFLLEMFNKSAKHNAIVLGKVGYVIGGGFQTEWKPNSYETATVLAKKLETDIRIFGGCYIEVQYNAKGEKAAFYHVPFVKVRTNKDCTQFFVKDWDSYKSDDAKKYLAYNPTLDKKALVNTSQIMFVKEYRPECNIYPLPDYLGSLNAIKTDVEISKYHLSTISNGMFSSKMITFFEPSATDEEKGDVEKSLKNKFTGSENAGSLVVNWGKDPNKKPIIDDLSNTELDKHFDLVAKTITQEIFTGHQITSPMLFGIKTEGQLGGRNEIREAYEIFKNTYINEKQQQLEEVFTELAGQEMKLIDVEPISFQFGEDTLKENMTKDEIREKIGLEPLDPAIKTQAQIISENINSLSPLVANKVLESMTPDEIRSLAGLIPKGSGGVMTEDGSMPLPSQEYGNDALLNLTGRQQQQLLRIVRLFTKGQLTKAQAALQLKAFGLSDEDVNAYLGLDDDPETEDYFSSQDENEILLAEFAACGESKDNYEILESKKAFQFATVTDLQGEILGLIQKDKRITTEIIAEVLQISHASATKIIDLLENKGYITSKAVRVGQDVIIERTLVEPVSKVTTERPSTLDFQILYSYEGPKDDRNRDFCARLLKLNRLYKRSEIEAMSKRLGYSVWDRRGGWWNDNGVTKIHCRHNWEKVVAIKKK